MRKIKFALTIAVFILASVEIALAIPQYYLFKGTIRSIEGNNRAIATDQGFKVGHPVEYLIMVDSYVMGKMVYTNGEIDYDTNEIYAELVAGNLLREIDGGYYVNHNGGAIGKEGSAYLSREIHLANFSRQAQKQIFIGNEDESIIINSNKNGAWDGYLQAYDSKGRKAAVHLDLEIASITNEIPYPFGKSASTMPESAAMLIFGAGLLGMAALLVRKKRQPETQAEPTIAIPVSEH